MEFKNSDMRFDESNPFGDEMKRFDDEAAKFTTESKEAASASNKSERFTDDGTSSTGREKGEIAEADITTGLEEVKDSRSESGSRDSADSKSSETPKEKEKKETAKKQEKDASEKKSDSKLAAAKTALTKVFKKNAESKDDVEKVSGNAFTDGNKGLVSLVTTTLNPMTYVRMFAAWLGALVAPFLAAFMLIAIVAVIIFMFIFSILEPIQKIGEAISDFLSFFTGEEVMVEDFEDGDEDDILAGLTLSDNQTAVISYALSKVGCEYSQEERTSGTKFDCSSLAYYAWASAGVDISYDGIPPTAAEMARQLEAEGKSLSTIDLAPGDLIFYGGQSNGRYMGIYHVAIYVGDAKVVEALNTEHGVVYQTLRPENVIMVCRPDM